jgi:hypothetical protein
MTPSVIDPATFRLVAQCLNQLRHRAPPNYVVSFAKYDQNLSRECGRKFHIVGFSQEHLNIGFVLDWDLHVYRASSSL